MGLFEMSCQYSPKMALKYQQLLEIYRDMGWCLCRSALSLILVVMQTHGQRALFPENPSSHVHQVRCRCTPRFTLPTRSENRSSLRRVHLQVHAAESDAKHAEWVASGIVKASWESFSICWSQGAGLAHWGNIVVFLLFRQMVCYAP
jgi:hypothetical protein